MDNTKNLHGYDSGYDISEGPDSPWNMIIEINNCTNAAKMFFGDHEPPLTALLQLKKAKVMIEKFIKKHDKK